MITIPVALRRMLLFWKVIHVSVHFIAPVQKIFRTRGPQSARILALRVILLRNCGSSRRRPTGRVGGRGHRPARLQILDCYICGECHFIRLVKIGRNDSGMIPFLRGRCSEASSGGRMIPSMLLSLSPGRISFPIRDLSRPWRRPIVVHCRRTLCRPARL
jgi:hypothetical protein